MKTSIVESGKTYSSLEHWSLLRLTKNSLRVVAPQININFESLCHVIISGNGHNTNGDFILKANVAGEAKIYRSRLASFPFTSELK